MHREHEDHMRGEYEQYHRLGQDMYQAETDAEIDRISAQREQIADRWQAGPHAQHWEYLGDAHEDWQRAPDTMRRFMDNVEFNRDRRTGLSNLTEVQQRSQEQARALTGNDHPRPRPQRGR
ncbi:hypothetical protein ACTD5D_30960 [Nocardia takedensis]|uniref:hypothetical protein n=1 Tax=Nocardia takedensis TaxID=259390 RepID=UPI003F75E916